MKEENELSLRGFLKKILVRLALLCLVGYGLAFVFWYLLLRPA